MRMRLARLRFGVALLLPAIQKVRDSANRVLLRVQVARDGNTRHQNGRVDPSRPPGARVLNSNLCFS